MSEPYYPARPGDPILADTWNNMQLQARAEIHNHTHRGGLDGKQLGGDSISPSAQLKVTRVEATDTLVVRNVDVTTRFQDLEAQKLSLTGGPLSGPLTVNANVGIGAAPGTKRLLVVAPANTEAPPPLEVRTTGSQTWGIGLVIKTMAGAEGASMLLRTRGKSWQVRGEPGPAALGLQITEDGGDPETGSGPGTPRLHIKAGGAVGLNTHDPQGALDVRLPGGASGFDRFVVNLTSDWSPGMSHVTIGAGQAAGLMINNPHVVWHKGESRASIRYGLSGGTASGLFWDVGARANNAFSFIVNNTSTMWMNADGNIGIGTQTPGARLDVQGGSLRVSGAITPSVGNSTGNGIQFPLDPWGGHGDAAYIRYFRPPNPLPGDEDHGRLVIGIENDLGDAFAISQGGAERLCIVNGNVGIGAARPSAPLHIQQRDPSLGIRLSENTSGRYIDIAYEGQGTFRMFHSSGNGRYMPQDGEWHKFSDVQLKENIESLQGILPRVLALRPVSFDLKSTGHHQMGLVAQEVEPLFPELVSDAPAREDGTPLKGLAYEAFSVLAIAALQELKAHYDTRIEALERRLHDPEKHG
ncbi:Chaperone of endosialidase [Myxococcus fulvus]|uniref:Chaperone of endosialidase n=1 Tax=Myxococcus fulvus TaxID=33 RepID=A0A511T8H9_MYXFU|nr:tail fiber domain-containing protein [Myxococcus fulvus]GEN10474.1 hypothetical protein MFU01_55110 [Myxococcus fulvus]SET81798.1 Chaperone of endosialidase [Myxococcus fulvus]